MWKKIAVIAATVAAIERNEQELATAFKTQDASNPGGQVAQKNRQLESFHHRIYRLGCKLSFYSKDTGDNTLLIDVAFAESTLKKISEKEALLRSHSIIQLGHKYLDRTANYGITAEELKALASELNELEKMQPAIGVITNERKSAVRSVKALIREASNLLEKLDDGFEGMIDDDNFIESWFAVRKIKGRHVSHPKKVAATIN